MISRFLILSLLLAAPASAHAVIDFDHAIPGVGAVVDGEYIPEIVLYFRGFHEDIEIRLRRGDEIIPIRSVSGKNTSAVTAKVPRRLRPGEYFVDWREKDEGGDLWHTYYFTVR